MLFSKMDDPDSFQAATLSLLIGGETTYIQLIKSHKSSQRMEPKLNLEKLKYLIKNGIKAIPIDQKSKQAIIVVGDTGVGKSTIMNYIANNKLVVRSQGLKPKLITEGVSILKIGHEKYSQTSIPTRVHIDGLAFYDCPGFRDNKGQEYEISNSFFVQKLLDVYEKVKIVLMIDQSHISEARADKLPRLTKNLLRSFKSFNDIKEGVILIINRADVDLSISDYAREINKLVALKNDRGYLFGEEEQNFLKYLVNNNRVKLFKQPQKKDNGKQFIGSEYERDIMPSIKRSDFVKSKHILNIVSQSAKIAIRDYIDDITIGSNVKIEKVSMKISEKVIQNVNKAGKNIQTLLQLKQSVMQLAEDIKNQQGQNILVLIKGELPDYDLKDFEEDFESIMFFKGIYDKTETYFSNLINKAYSELSIVLNRLDTKIIRLQKQEQEELERRQLLLRRKQIQNQREREKFETMRQVKQINDLRNQVTDMSKSSLSIIKSMGDTLNYLTNLEQEFVSLKSDATRLKLINNQLNEEFHNFSSVHMKNVA